MYPVGELSNLRQTGTVDEYDRQFKEYLGRQSKLTGDQQLWQFCAGLTDSLKKEVEYLCPEAIFKAMEYAQDNEYKINNDRRTRMFGGHLAPPARSRMNDMEALNASTRRSKTCTTKYLKKLTVVEMAERAKGLFFQL
uniref:Retrotransposon gag domain-containing protein n=1 Tax=Noccaea caerulescens TaxID=107243 RepID=A0A1J3IIR2_NOCCA